MTQRDVLGLLTILQANYPRFYADMTPESLKICADTWTVMLSDTSLEIATLALQRLIATSKFPPTIAELRESISAVRNPQLPDSGEAWGEVLEAIRLYGYYRPEEALSSLREPVREAVRRMGWRDLCMSENGMADRAHFLRIYETMEKRINEDRQLPTMLKSAIAQIGKSVDGICDNSQSSQIHLNKNKIKIQQN